MLIPALSDGNPLRFTNVYGQYGYQIFPGIEVRHYTREKLFLPPGLQMYLDDNRFFDVRPIVRSLKWDTEEVIGDTICL